MDRALRRRRGELEERWRSGVPGRAPEVAARDAVASSWARSSRSVATEIPGAPLVDPDGTASQWDESRFGRASRVVLDDLAELAAGGEFVAAVADADVTIVWARGGRRMARMAEAVHFTPGGRWAEESVGTNALALASLTNRPESVFSAEHFAPMVHDWVCYSAPVVDPVSGAFAGVIDVSTLWNRANPALLTTVAALARCVEYELAADRAAPAHGAVVAPATGGVLELVTLGRQRVSVDGREVHVTPRQLELLAVLALHPEGLSLDELTGHVHGDRPVRPGTVKAELSHLRHALGGRIGSRPYRLEGGVRADVVDLVDALDSGDVAGAVRLYGGPFLPFAEGPELGGWRTRIDVAVRDAAVRSGGPDALVALARSCPEDATLHRAALAALAPGDPRVSVLAGLLAAAEGG